MDENKLTQEEVQAIRAEVWAEDADVGMESVERPQRIVAEGDSWFDYPPGLDILTQLRRRHKYCIYRVSEAGDTIENMAFGTEIRRNFTRRMPQLVETLEAIRRHRPPVVLLSGGGNDFAGPEFEAFLNHKDAGGASLLREVYLKDVLAGTFRKAYDHIAGKIWAEDAGIHVVVHGYGYPIPDGRAVVNFPFGFRFFGPWLRPALAKKNITGLQDGRGILAKVIDLFNEMLDGFAQSDDRIHYLNLRPVIRDEDWVNELHLNNDAFAKVADVFHTKIEEILRQQGPVPPPLGN